MPRNQAKPLTEWERAVQDRAFAMLKEVNDANGTVELQYYKRNGDLSSSTGQVAFFGGKPGYDTGSVTILTKDKGMRTINMHRIKAHRNV